MTTITDVLSRVEQCYDAIPRVGGAQSRALGPFELFIRTGAGWPYYARPRLGTTSATIADVEAVRAAQRELGAPEAFEWVHDVSPGVLAAVEASGLSVLHAPLMMLDPARLAPDPSGGQTEIMLAEIMLLDPDQPDFAEMFALSTAVASVGFGAEGTRCGTPGPAERDAARATPDPAQLAHVADGLRAGHKAEAVALSREWGMVARGASQAAAGAAEIVGVATLPAARRRGLGAAVSALLARHALERGHDLVFLSAASDDVARVYARVGFYRVGTACIAEATPRP